MMTRLTPVLALCLALGFGALPAAAQDDMRTETVRFAAGSTGTTITDRITGRESVAFTLGAEAGQRMKIALESNNGATYFTVFGPGQAPGGGGLAGSDIPGPMVPDLNRFDAKLTSSGQYMVLVYLYRSAARRGEVSDFTLDISITGSSSAVVKGDFADGLQGGPDFFAVRTASAAGHINVRSGPSTSTSVVGIARNGTILANLGCRMNEGRRWCRVATEGYPDIEGWAAGEYLVEASGMGGVATQLPEMQPIPVPEGDALVPGTNFNATGLIDCVPDMDAAETTCEFGVEREGNGNGWITVFMPDGEALELRFEDLTPMSFDESGRWAGQTMTVDQSGDMFTVFVGPTRLVFPLAVMDGG
jgi:hypothetical protein